MAYVTPPTFSGVVPVASADLNILGDDIVWLRSLLYSGTTSLTAASGNISNAEVVAISYSIPANAITAGTTFRITAHGSVNWVSGAASTFNFRIRLGPTTLTGAIVATRSPVATVTASNNGFGFDGTVTARSAGGAGTAIGNFVVIGSGTQPFANSTYASESTSTVSVDTTVANLLELTVEGSTANTTLNMRDGYIGIVRP